MMSTSTDDPAASLEAYLDAVRRGLGYPPEDGVPLQKVGPAVLRVGDLRRAVVALRRAGADRLRLEVDLEAARVTAAALLAEVSRLTPPPAGGYDPDTDAAPRPSSSPSHSS